MYVCKYVSASPRRVVVLTTDSTLDRVMPCRACHGSLHTHIQGSSVKRQYVHTYVYTHACNVI